VSTTRTEGIADPDVPYGRLPDCAARSIPWCNCSKGVLKGRRWNDSARKKPDVPAAHRNEIQLFLSRLRGALQTHRRSLVGIGRVLDENTALLFTLRNVDQQDPSPKAGSRWTKPKTARLSRNG